MPEVVRVSEKGFAICEWCNCEAWCPMNRLMLTCDCNRTVVFHTKPDKPMSDTARRMMEKCASDPTLAGRTLDALREFANAPDEEEDDPEWERIIALSPEELDCELSDAGIDMDAFNKRIEDTLAGLKHRLQSAACDRWDQELEADNERSAQLPLMQRPLNAAHWNRTRPSPYIPKEQRATNDPTQEVRKDVGGVG